MKFAQFLFCLAPFAVAGLARADEISATVVELPAMVVEATRVADPVATLRAALEERAQVSLRTRLTVKFGRFSRMASDDKAMGARTHANQYLFRSAGSAAPVL